MPFRRLFCLLLACLVLAGCQPHGTDASGGATPVQALRQSIALLRAGHFADLVKQALPPSDYATLRADWRRDPAEEQRFPRALRERADNVLRSLTQPDAGTRLTAQLLPKLVAAQNKYGDQILIIIGVGQALLDKRIENNATLTDGQKQQVHDVLAALTPWARTAPWFDPERARQAIALAVATARGLRVTRVEQLQAMDFDAAMGAYAQLYVGAEKLLAVYGLSIDDTLASVRLTPLAQAAADPHRTGVQIDYVLAGKPVSARVDMTELGGRWYSAAIVDAARAQHARLNVLTAHGASPGTDAPANRPR